MKSLIKLECLSRRPVLIFFSNTYIPISVDYVVSRECIKSLNLPKLATMPEIT